MLYKNKIRKTWLIIPKKKKKTSNLKEILIYFNNKLKLGNDTVI